MKQKYFLFWLLIANFSLFAQNATHLNFDGVDDVVTIPNSNSLDFTVGNFTLEAMVKLNGSQSDYAGIIAKASVNSPFIGCQLVILNDRLALEFGNINVITVEATTGLNDNKWHHVACVVDRANNNIKLFVDGIIEANETNNSIGTADISSTVSMFIGKERNTLRFLRSDVDEVRIWNIARTDAQILESKDCELAGTETGLVSYYKFNQGVDTLDNSLVTTLTDATANANNGTLSGFALTGSTSNWVAGSPIITGKTCTSLSTSSFVEATKVSIYPNPSSGIFTIETKEDVKVDVYDILGKKIVTKSFNSGANGLDVTKYANGIYLVNVITKEGNQTTYRIVKE